MTHRNFDFFAIEAEAASAVFRIPGESLGIEEAPEAPGTLYVNWPESMRLNKVQQAAVLAAVRAVLPDEFKDFKLHIT